MITYPKHRIQAHEGNVRCIDLTEDGRLMATSSDGGTVIRLWDLETEQLIGSFKRGLANVDMYSLDIRWGEDEASSKF